VVFNFQKNNKLPQS